MASMRPSGRITLLAASVSLASLAGLSLGGGAALAQTTLTIATVNNGDMIRMQALTSDFTAKNPDIQLNWVTLEENVLRERVTVVPAEGGSGR